MRISTIADILAGADGDPVKLRAIRDALEWLADELTEIADRQVLFVGDHMVVEEENKSFYKQRQPPEWLGEWLSK